MCCSISRIIIKSHKILLSRDKSLCAERAWVSQAGSFFAPSRAGSTCGRTVVGRPAYHSPQQLTVKKMMKTKHFFLCAMEGSLHWARKKLAGVPLSRVNMRPSRPSAAQVANTQAAAQAFVYDQWKTTFCSCQITWTHQHCARLQCVYWKHRQHSRMEAFRKREFSRNATKRLARLGGRTGVTAALIGWLAIRRITKRFQMNDCRLSSWQLILEQMNGWMSIHDRLSTLHTLPFALSFWRGLEKKPNIDRERSRDLVNLTSEIWNPLGKCMT